MRRALLISFLLFAMTFLLYSESIVNSSELDKCVGCHSKTYTRSLSSRYSHSIVNRGCSICHIKEEFGNNNENDLQISYPSYQQDRIIHLDDLKKDNEYLMEVSLTDHSGDTSEARSIRFIPGNLWDYNNKVLIVKNIFGIEVKEVRKRGYASARVAWETDSFATSEIEYRTAGEYGRKKTVKSQYAKSHTVELTGLAHSKKYMYRIIAKDIKGSVVQSKEHTFDTSDSFTISDTEPDQYDQPIELISASLFRVEKDNEVFARLSASKPSEVSIRLLEIMSEDKKHGKGLLPERFSTIEVCYKCHPKNASHPVGVRSKGHDIVVPDSFPTIENGIITCVTCHDPHGSSRKYFTRIDYKKDLCIHCHIKGY